MRELNVNCTIKKASSTSDLEKIVLKMNEIRNELLKTELKVVY